MVGALRSNPKDTEAFAEPFRRYVKAIGWEEGRNIRFLFVWAEGRNERAPALAGELVAKNVDLIITFGDPAIRAAQRATQTIPIVGMTDDMIGSGLVVSMARPGGNTTGVSILTLELDVKRLEILHEFLPQARRIAVLADPSTISTRAQLTSAARDLALELVRFEAQSPDEIGNALDAVASAKVDAVNVLASPILNAAHRLIIERMHNARLPTIYQFPESAEDGGLLAYGPRVSESYRRDEVASVRSRTARVMMTLMRNGRDRRSENPFRATRGKNACFCLGPISGSHQGQRPKRLHSKAGYMAAPERFAKTSDSFPLHRGRRPYMHEGCLRKPFRFYKSTDVRNPFWGFYFGRCDRLRRKLEHRGFLTFIKLGEQHHLSVGEFQRIMMSVGLVLVDLPKDGRRVIDHSRLPRKQPTWAAAYRSGEGKLCSREKANRRVGIFRCSKPYSARSEMLGCQFLSDFSRTRSYGL